nr:hypothetical protein [Tanacetum cinerariifolium]
EDQGFKDGEDEWLNEEEEADELYRDVEINQGRGLQISQDIEDSHVTLTLVKPDGMESIFATASSSVASLPTPTPTMTPSIITTITTASHLPIPPTPIPSEVLQNLPTFDSVFCFDERLKSLEANFSEYRQTNPFAEAVSNIPGIVHQYMNQQMNETVPVAVQIQTDRLRDSYQRENDELLRTIDDNMKRIIKEQHTEWFSQPKKPLTLDRDWNKTLPDAQGSTQSWICELEKQADSRSSFNELLDTSIDFSNFIMNRVGVDTLTPKLFAGPTYELIKGSCKSLIELEYHLEEVYKAMTDQQDWINPEGQQYSHNLLHPLPLIPDNRGRRVIPFAHFINNDLEYLRGGASSRKYTTSVTKTKAADYGHIKWIEYLVPHTMWIQEPINYDKHALWRVSH